MREGRCWRCRGSANPCSACDTPWPTFGLLGGMQMLARTLLAYYEVDPDDHPAVMAELEVAIGEELLDLGRSVLAERGIPIPAEVGLLPPAAPPRPKRRHSSRQVA